MKKFNNSSVLAIAVANTLKDAQFSSDRVIELLKYAGKSSMEDMLRCLYYLTGQLQMPDPASIVKDRDGRLLAFKSYNIFEDRLKFEYERTDHRCFKTEAEANVFATKGDYDWNKSKSTSTPSDEYPFPAEWTYVTDSYCGLDTWESYSPVEK